MKHPLSRCAPSPRKGDDSLAAGRPLLAVPGVGQASFMRCAMNLSRCAPSLWKGDDSLAAGRRGRHRPFLGVSHLGRASFMRCAMNL